MSSTQSIYSKLLQLEEIKTIHKEHMQCDFPPDEIKPFRLIRKLWNNGCYKCYGFYSNEDDKLHAYAFTMADDTGNMLLLDYFAVCSGDRGKGYGSQALMLLKEACRECAGMIIEVEDDDSAAAEKEKAVRRRRISFYERNHVRMTAEKSTAFGVDYKLMILPIGNERAEENLGEKLASIYRRMLPEQIYKMAFRLRK